jgi:hypothetical protein
MFTVDANAMNAAVDFFEGEIRILDMCLISSADIEPFAAPAAKVQL